MGGSKRTATAAGWFAKAVYGNRAVTLFARRLAPHGGTPPSGGTFVLKAQSARVEAGRASTSDAPYRRGYASKAQGKLGGDRVGEGARSVILMPQAELQFHLGVGAQPVAGGDIEAPDVATPREAPSRAVVEV